MKEHPDYKYRPRRKAKSLSKKDNRYHFPLPLFPPMLDSLRPFYSPAHLLPTHSLHTGSEKSPGDIPRPLLPPPPLFPSHLTGFPYPPMDPVVLSRLSSSTDGVNLSKLSASETLTIPKITSVDSSLLARLASHDVFGVTRLSSPPLQSHLPSSQLAASSSSSSGLTVAGVGSSLSPQGLPSPPNHHPGSPTLIPSSLASPVPKYPSEIAATSVLSRLPLDHPYHGLSHRDLEHLHLQHLHYLDQERRMREELAASPQPSRSRSASPSSPKIDVDSHSRESSPVRSPITVDPPSDEGAFKRFSAISTREEDTEVSVAEESRGFVRYSEKKANHTDAPGSNCHSPVAPEPLRLAPPFSSASLATSLYPSNQHHSPPTIVSAAMARSYFTGCMYPSGTAAGYPADPRAALSYLLVRPEAKYLPTPVITPSSPTSVVQ
ncbi:hypothetical protein SK128_016819 [Halocaridina rubra]|uniref:Uncharacterized protein n=1 Tax=Halocaridina rubra TaxID=373956 RepID=A0AAN8WHG6_HALRR